ncbi:hypothetical protein UG55_103946 [Frankia sp. EI5c]|uniref:hypothetical protein n=1 Tax=Frankia sp. EI5c TaxID=683316 RepID=UPI0007C2979C|nr:hypothetical protein [Frankia sp. EI5c]OAA23258.1 hypothetical protein UG55_103946 [Frankia sp. EI5c]
MVDIRVSPDEARVLRAVADGQVEYRWRWGRSSDLYTIGGENVTITARPLARRGLIWHPPGSSHPELSPVAAAWVAAHPVTGPSGHGNDTGRGPAEPRDDRDGPDGPECQECPDAG